MNEEAFELAFNKTMLIEGGYSMDRFDPGGETYMGISRVYWPDWEGWTWIDSESIQGNPIQKTLLQTAVRRFYRTNFWNIIRGNDLAQYTTDLSSEVFDTSVNLSTDKASKFLQEALNLLNANQSLYPDLMIDGQLGPKSMYCLDQYTKKTNTMTLLLNVLNNLQGEYYINKMRKYPEKERWRGWFLRT